MTVFVEPLGDIAGLADGREVVFEIGVVRENHAGSGMVTPRRVSVSPVNGVLTTPSLDPGPARVCIAFEWFDITIPDASGSQRLWPVIKDSVPYEPPVVSLVKQYRDEVVSAKDGVQESLEYYGGVLTGLTDRAEDAADRAEAAADRAEAAEGGGSGVPAGGWPLSSLAQEVIDEFGGGVTLPIGLADLSSGVQTSLGKAESASQPGHKHDAADINTGTMLVAHGGTGRSTFAANSYLRGDGQFVVKSDSFETVRANIGAVATDDSRLSDARTPKAHTHSGADITAIIDTEDGPVEVNMDIVASTIGSMIQTLDEKAPLDSPVFTGRVEMTDVKITGGSPGVGKVFTSDGSGVGSWQPGGASGLKVTGPYLAGSPNSVGPVVDPAQTNSTPYSNVLMGSGSNTTSNASVAVGQGASVGGQGGIAIGDDARVGGGAGGATAVGRYTRANHGSSTALGANATTTKMNQVMLGTNLQVVTIPNKAEIGEGTTMATLSTRLTGGKAELVVQFATGSLIVLATQP